MSPTQVSPYDPGAFSEMQEILSRNLAHGGPRYSIHPGDLAWWAYHSYPREEDDSYWLEEGTGFAVLERHENEVVAFSLPGQSPAALALWGLDHMGPAARIGMVSTEDLDLEAALRSEGLETGASFGPVFLRDLAEPIPAIGLPSGWALRHVRGEEDADSRRRASHAAFASTMDPADHLERYLRFMRSPVYDPERDLVVVSEDGEVAAFMIWWPDRSGIAEIEPMGTDPKFHRQGLGRALMAHGLNRMREAGMTTARVITNSHRSDAIAFYEAMGFRRVADLRNWQRLVK